MVTNRFAAVVVSLLLSVSLFAPCAAATPVNVQLVLNSAGRDASPPGWCDGENSSSKGYTFYWFAVDKASDCNQWAYQGQYLMWSMPVPNGPNDQPSCQADLKAIAAKSLPVTPGAVCVCDCAQHWGSRSSW